MSLVIWQIKIKENDDFKPFSTIIWEMELVDVLKLVIFSLKPHLN